MMGVFSPRLMADRVSDELFGNLRHYMSNLARTTDILLSDALWTAEMPKDVVLKEDVSGSAVLEKYQELVLGYRKVIECLKDTTRAKAIFDRIDRRQLLRPSKPANCSPRTKRFYKERELNFPSCHGIGESLGRVYERIKAVEDELVRTELLRDFKKVQRAFDGLIFSVLRLHDASAALNEADRKRVKVGAIEKAQKAMEASRADYRLAIDKLEKKKSMSPGGLNQNALPNSLRVEKDDECETSIKAKQNFERSLANVTRAISEFRQKTLKTLKLDRVGVSEKDQEKLVEISGSLEDLVKIGSQAEPDLGRSEEMLYYMKELVLSSKQNVKRGELRALVSRLSDEISGMKRQIEKLSVVDPKSDVSAECGERGRPLGVKSRPPGSLASIWRRERTLEALSAYNTGNKHLFRTRRNRGDGAEFDLEGNARIAKKDCRRLYGMIRRIRRHHGGQKAKSSTKKVSPKAAIELQNALKVDRLLDSGYFEWERHFDRYRLGNECEDKILEAWCRLRGDCADESAEVLAETKSTQIPSAANLEIDEETAVPAKKTDFDGCECCGSVCMCDCSTCPSSICDEENEDSSLCSDLCCQSESCVCFQKTKNSDCIEGICCESSSCLCVVGKCSESCCGSESCICVAGKCSESCCGSSSCLCVAGKCSESCCGSESCICVLKRSQESCCGSESCLCVAGKCSESCCGSQSCICMKSVTNTECLMGDCCQSESCVCFQKTTNSECTQGICCESSSCLCLAGKCSESCCGSESCICVSKRSKESCCGSESCLCVSGKCSESCCRSESCLCVSGKCSESCCGSESCLCVAGKCSESCCGSESCICFAGKCSESCCGSESCLCVSGKCSESCCGSESCICVVGKCSESCCGSESCLCVAGKCSESCCGSESCLCVINQRQIMESCGLCGLRPCICAETEGKAITFPELRQIEPIICDRTPDNAKSWKDIVTNEEFAFDSNAHDVLCGGGPSLFFRKLIDASANKE